MCRAPRRISNMTETWSGRVGTVYACFFFNALLFVVLMSTNITAAIIYLFCCASLVAVCSGIACTRYLCETYAPTRVSSSSDV